MLDFTWLLGLGQACAAADRWSTEAGAVGTVAMGGFYGVLSFAAPHSLDPLAQRRVFDLPALRLLGFRPFESRRARFEPRFPASWLALVGKLGSAFTAMTAGLVRATSPTGVLVEWAPFAQLLISLDPLLLAAELCGIAVLLLVSSRALAQVTMAQPFYDDLVTLCQTRNVSITEVLGLLTLTLGLLVFDAMLALSEDDVFDNVGYLLLTCVLLVTVMTLLGVDAQYFLMTSGASSGEPRLRLVYGDVLNNVLSLTRVLFCWLRYLFYDLQAELVDMGFHYAETNDTAGALGAAFLAPLGGTEAQGLLWGSVSAVALQLLAAFCDLACWAFQTVLGGLKLMLALYLFWLVLDILMLRPVSFTETLGWVGRGARAQRSLRTTQRRLRRRGARRTPRYIR